MSAKWKFNVVKRGSWSKTYAIRNLLFNEGHVGIQQKSWTHLWWVVGYYDNF